MAFRAISKEPSNNSQKSSRISYLNLIASQYLKEPEITLINPAQNQKTGLETKLQFFNNLPLGSKTLKIYLDLPKGSYVEEKSIFKNADYKC